MKVTINLKLKLNSPVPMFFLLIFSQMASIEIVRDISFGGHSWISYSIYLIFLIVALNSILYFLSAGKYFKICGLFLTAFAISFIYSILIGNSISSILIEMCRYFIIVMIFFWVERHTIDIGHIRKLIYILIPIMMYITIMSSFGYMNGISDDSGGLLRNSADVDGTLGVICSIFCFNLITCERRIKLIDYIMFFLSVSTVCFSLSRARIMCLCICIMVQLVFNLINNKERTFRNYVPIIILGICVLFLFSNTVEELFNQIIFRFNNLATDNNMAIRELEIQRHMEEIQQHPILGIGFGSLENKLFNVHCSYTAIVMYMGVLFGLIYISWFVYILFRCLRKCSQSSNSIRFCQLAVLCVIAILFLAYGNMGFNKMGGIVGMLVSYVAFNEHQKLN